MGKPTSVKDVDQFKMVNSVASFLKKSGKVKVPEWSDVVKLGTLKELAPVDPDWYYYRTASLARRLYFRTPAGVGKFRKVYGANKRRGVVPNRFTKASGSCIRKALQTLESLKWVEKHPDGGRRLTAQGRKDLDRIASQLRFNKTASE
uniref:Ribosomal protein S19 n=2 Tax=Panagrolaimus TaxID=55784 RepID=A0A914YG32_9BILA